MPISNALQFLKPGEANRLTFGNFPFINNDLFLGGSLWLTDITGSLRQVWRRRKNNDWIWSYFEIKLKIWSGAGSDESVLKLSWWVKDGLYGWESEEQYHVAASEEFSTDWRITNENTSGMFEEWWNLWLTGLPTFTAYALFPSFPMWGWTFLQLFRVMCAPSYIQLLGSWALENF